MGGLMKIKHFPKNNVTELIPICCEAWTYFANHSTEVEYRVTEAIVACEGKKPIGIIMFYPIENNKLWILYGFVTEKCREKGVYRKMWDTLVKHAKKNSYSEINSAIHSDNETMKKVLAKFGRVAPVHRVEYVYKVKKEK